MKAAILIVAASLISATTAFATPTRNVHVGGHAEDDACKSIGVVLASTTVFTFKRQGRMTMDKVDVNQFVYFCEADGDFIGIIYSPQPGMDCRVNKPIEKAQEYTGPCKSGWIKKHFFEHL